MIVEAVPKMASEEVIRLEIEKLKDHISALIGAGKMTDGGALLAVAESLEDQVWMPENYREARQRVIRDTMLVLSEISRRAVADIACIKNV